MISPYEKRYKVTDVMLAFGLLRDHCPDFDPCNEYPQTKDSEVMNVSDQGHSTKVGKIYRLVETMVEQEAPEEEIVRGVKYMAVVIDAVKHKLDYKRAYSELGIAELGKRYYSRVVIL